MPWDVVWVWKLQGHEIETLSTKKTLKNVIDEVWSDKPLKSVPPPKQVTLDSNAANSTGPRAPPKPTTPPPPPPPELPAPRPLLPRGTCCSTSGSISSCDGEFVAILGQICRVIYVSWGTSGSCGFNTENCDKYEKCNYVSWFYHCVNAAFSQLAKIWRSKWWNTQR